MNATFCPKCGTHLLLDSNVLSSKKIKCSACGLIFDNPFANASKRKTFINENVNSENELFKNIQSIKTKYWVIGIGILILIFSVFSYQENDSSKSSFNNEPTLVYKLRSTSYDIEKPNSSSYQTVNEITHHVFDFEKQKVTFKGVNSNGKYTTISYQIKNSYKETGLLAETWVLVIRQYGIKEIWFSPQANNLGYDLEDGTRLAFYGITREE